MRKILLPLVLLAALSLLAGACDSDAGPYAARVNGTEISNSQLDSYLGAIKADPGFACVVQQSYPIDGAGPSTYASQFAASELTVLIEVDAIGQVVTADHLASTPLSQAIARGELASALTGQTGSGCTTPGAVVLADLSPSGRAVLVRLQEEQDLLEAHAAGITLSEKGIAAYAATHPGVVDETCVSAIVVSSKAKAAKLRTLITSGANFADIARADSTDPTSAKAGGAIGCLMAGQLTPPLSTIIGGLAVGQVSPPVSLGSNWGLLLVTSRHAAPAVAAATAVVEAASQDISPLVTRTISHAAVSVDPSYGSWKDVKGTYQVVPPNGPPETLLSNANAITPLGETVNG